MSAPPFAWGVGEIHVDVVAGAAGAALLYAWGWRSTRPAGPGDGGRPLRFGAGLLALLVTLNGPLHDLADTYLFSAHMLQHLVLTLVVPPLLLGGMPSAMLDPLLAPFLVGRLSRRLFTQPLLQLALYTIALALWHLPGPYGAALAWHPLHVVQHLTLLATATLAWWPILSPSRQAPALPPAAQLLYLFAFGMPMTVVAAMVTGADRVLYSAYAEAPRTLGLSPLDDQRLGGVLMWVPAGLVPLAAFTAVFFRWARAEAEP